MEALKHLLPILLTVSLGLLVVAAGMASSRGDFLYVLRQPGLLGKSALAVLVIPLVAAMLIVGLFPISHATKAGILLMAISPVPPLMPGKALKFGGEAEYVYGLQAAFALLAIVTVPLLGWFIATFYNVDAQFPASVVAGNVFVGLIVPLAIGLALGRWLFRNASPRVPHVISIIANVLVVIAFIPILIATWPQIEALIGDGSVIAMALVVVLALAGGHFLGGPELAGRSTLGFAAAIRHPGIALALAGANDSDKPISAAVLLFMLVGIVVLIPYQMILRRMLPTAADQVRDAGRITQRNPTCDVDVSTGWAWRAAGRYRRQ